MSSKIQKYNKHSDEMCHAFGCRKHKKLNRIFNGKFCKHHMNILYDIRNNLYITKNTKNIELENYWRQKEIELRKFHDLGHMKYKKWVENNIERKN